MLNFSVSTGTVDRQRYYVNRSYARLANTALDVCRRWTPHAERIARDAARLTTSIS